MKKVIILALTGILILACSKKDDETGGGYPASLFLYFDIKKSDGTPFEEGEVFYYQRYDGQPSNHPEEWYVLNKTLNELLGQELYFGPCGEYMYGWEYGDEPDAGSQWVTKTYVYLKYMDTEVIDTIVLRDSIYYPEYRYFDLFLNGEKIEYTMAPNQIEWLVSLTKDEF
jgi:hypothetical protein